MPRRKAELLTGRAGVRRVMWRGQPAFYRVTGYRDSAGRWLERNPRTGHWIYKSTRRRARTPTPDVLRASDQLNIELDIGDGQIRYFSMPGSSIGQ